MTNNREEPQRNRAGRMGRAALKFCGIVLCLSAFGLWLDAESLSRQDSVTIRAALTCLLIGGGFLLFRMGGQGGEEFVIDAEQGRLLHLDRGRGGKARVLRSFDLDELGALDAEGNVLVVRTKGGGELLRVDVSPAVIDRIGARRASTGMP